MRAFAKIALSLLSGLLLAAAWPAHGVTALVFVAFVPLLFVEDSAIKEKKGLFPYSFVAFLVWNVLTTWWIFKATPASVAAFLVNSLLMALALQTAHLTRKSLAPHSIWGLLPLLLYWPVMEMLTQHWSLKWPWLNLGNAFSPHTEWIQWYEFTGIAGGTIWILLSNILIFSFLKSIMEHRKKTVVSIRASLSVLVIMAPMLASDVCYTNYKDAGEDTVVVVVQQNIDPWDTANTDNISRNIRLADSLADGSTVFVVGSELTVTDNFWIGRGETKSVRRLRDFVCLHPGMAFVVGAETFETVPHGMEDDFAARRFSNSEGLYFTHNSALLIDSNALQMRHKTQLVPGAEAMPRWTAFLKRFAFAAPAVESSLKGDTTVRNLHFGGCDAAVMICYESAFGGYVARYVRHGADLIFVITNDGWWGDTPGYRQHFEMAKLRAVENRRCVAQAANTGISGFINQRGEAIMQTSYWTETAVRSTMKANSKTTFYSRHGDYLYSIAAWSCLPLFALTLFFAASRRKSRKNKHIGTDNS